MSLVLRCPTCDTEVDVRRRHLGSDIACPGVSCRATISVPRGIDTGTRIRGVIADRKRADWLTLFSLVACVLWMPVVPAAAWFLASRRIRLARQENRKVALELHTARTTAIVAAAAQLLWYAFRYAKIHHDFGFGTFIGW